MRPIYLEISGFGAYVEKQVIDFSCLDGKNIFVITGPTGSGKTTIFDAISYALYGTASGSSREGKSVRSDYADDTVDTYVELIFEVKGVQYKIRRNPDYYKKKVKGEGLKKISDKVELVMPDGKVFVKKTDVSSRVKDILGIDKDQFRQIVMLPQGEFKKMLESNSNEKEKIFRKVFNTDRFNRFQEYIGKKTADMLQEISSMMNQKSIHIGTIECNNDEELYNAINSEDKDSEYIVSMTKRLIEKDIKESNNIKKDIDNKKKEIINLVDEKSKGIQINKDLQEKKDIEYKKDTLNARLPIVKENENLLSKARRALKVKVIDDNLIDKKKDVKIEERSLEDINKNIIKINDECILNESLLNIEVSKEKEREELSNKIAELNRYVDRIKGYDNKKKDLQDISIRLKKERDELENNKRQVSILRGNCDEYEKMISKLKETKIKIEEKRNEYREVNQFKLELEDYIDKCIKRNTVVDHHTDKSKEYDIKQKEVLIKKNKYDELEEEFRREQAGILAQKLEDGVKCPVCGSIHHPEPAILSKQVVNEEELKQYKRAYEELEAEKNNKYNEVQKLFSDIKNFNENIEEIKLKLIDRDSSCEYIFKDTTLRNAKVFLKEVDRRLSTIKNEGDKMRGEINAEESTNKSLNESRLEIKRLEASIEQLSITINEEIKVESQYNTEIKSLENDIPQEIRSEVLLNNKIDSMSKQLRSMKEALNKCQDDLSKKKIELASEKAKAKSKKEYIDTLLSDIKNLECQLSQSLIDMNFKDYNDYIESIMDEEQITELDNNIRDYYENIASINELYKSLEEKTNGVLPIDISLIEDKIAKCTDEENLLIDTNNKIVNRVSNNKKAVKHINDIQDKIADKEARYKLYSKINNASNGNNKSKISFERFVLAAYFNDVIEAANIRLNQLSDGRFQLSRRESVIDGRKRKEGLEIDVYDYYTGKSRPVGTLSGGESFKASLALALGLSDVIQSYAGGVEMNTMFVDEGFGSLDEESLDNAIDCLLDLQSGGRLVGIISHVQAIKDRIGTRIEVTKDISGSKLQFKM